MGFYFKLSFYEKCITESEEFEKHIREIISNALMNTNENLIYQRSCLLSLLEKVKSEIKVIKLRIVEHRKKVTEIANELNSSELSKEEKVKLFKALFMYDISFEPIEKQDKVSTDFLLNNYFQDSVRLRDLQIHFCEILSRTIKERIKVINNTLEESNLSNKKDRVKNEVIKVGNNKLVVINDKISTIKSNHIDYLVVKNLLIIDLIKLILYIQMKFNSKDSYSKVSRFIFEKVKVKKGNNLLPISTSINSIKNSLSKLKNEPNFIESCLNLDKLKQELETKGIELNHSNEKLLRDYLNQNL